jgi:hypothetical protein
MTASPTTASGRTAASIRSVSSVPALKARAKADLPSVSEPPRVLRLTVVDVDDCFAAFREGDAFASESPPRTPRSPAGQGPVAPGGRHDGDRRRRGGGHDMTRRLVDPDTAPTDYTLRRLGVRSQRRTDTEVRHLQAYGRLDPATAPPVVSGSRVGRDGAAKPAGGARAARHRSRRRRTDGLAAVMPARSRRVASSART